MKNEQKIEIISKHFAEILKTLGLDIRDASIKDTPKRVAKMLVLETCAGLNPENEPKITMFPNTNKYNQMLVEHNITVSSICEHHFKDFMGVCHIAYIPNKKIIGLSKFHRIVKYFSRRPQVQEKLTQQIADYLTKKLGTKDVAVVIQAKHLCVQCRGIEDQHSFTTTSYIGGAFERHEVRQEFFNLINNGTLHGNK